MTASNGLKDITLNRSISDRLIDFASSFYQIVTFELTEVRLREATIHKQFRSRDIAGIVGCEKHPRPGELIRLSNSAERNNGPNHPQTLLPRV
jgi:hypothetical protein